MEPTPLRGTEKTLTVCCDAGLANRIKVLVSGQVIAEAASREFSMLWPLTRACSSPFHTLFADQRGVTTVGGDHPLPPRLNGWFHQLDDLLAATGLHLEVNYVDWLIKPGLYKGHDQLWERCLERLRQLRPIPELQEQIDAFVDARFQPTMIGVHLRRGDFLRARPEVAGNTTEVMAELDRRLAEHPKAGILLCTDDGAMDPFKGRIASEGVRQHFLERYGARIVQPEARSLNRHRPEAAQDALVELMLLQRTDRLIGTAGSSFSLLAGLGGDIPAQHIGGGLTSYRRLVFWMKLTGIYHLVMICARVQFRRYVPFKVALNYYRVTFGKPVLNVLNRLFSREAADS